MTERVATISSENQITLPAEIRRRLGVGPSDKVAFVLTPSGDTVVRRARYSLENVIGSIKALPGESIDPDDEIERATESEAVLAEVAFILTAKSHYQLPVGEAAALLGAVVSSLGLKMSGKRTGLRGLDLWSSHPRLGFVDALAAAYAQLPGMQLATFDRELGNIPNIQRWQFADSH